MRIVLDVKSLNYSYQVFEKKAGIFGMLRDFIKREYREKQVLHQLELTVNEGEIIGLLGPNGAGKTTLIKILCGILEVDNNAVTCLGERPFERRKSFLQSIGVVMGQKSQLIWDLPAMDTLNMLKEIYEVETVAFHERVNELASLLYVKDKLNIPVRKLSLGERVKFELMCALIHQPKLLFLDEPTIGLDVLSQRSIYDFLRHLNQIERTTIILTSHYMKDIEQLCKRVVILLNGTKKEDISLSALKQKYTYATRYIIETKDGSFPFDTNLHLQVNRLSDNQFEIINIEEGQLINNLDLSKVVYMKEAVPELEDVIFDIFSKEKKIS